MNVELLTEMLAGAALFLAVPWIFYSLFSTFCDATVGYIDEWLLTKVASDDSRISVDAPGQLILISGLFGIVVSAVVLLVVSISPQLYLDLSKESFLNAFAAGVLEVIWLIPYFYALNRAGALNATPLFQTVPIFSLFFGLTFFGEVPTLLHIVATALIISGAVLLNYSPSIRKLDYKTIFLMLLASSIISIGYFLFKDAAEIANFATAAFGNGLGMGFLSICIWIIWKPYREQFIERLRTFDKKIIAIQTANEGLYTVAAVFNQLALVFGPSVMIVSAMSAFHPVFTLLIGGTLARLGFSSYSDTFNGVGRYTKAIAILTMAIGTILIVVDLGSL